MDKPQVSLVGAGPWDPELLTLKGKRCLRSADVILYDDLVNPELCRFAPKWAQKIYVGKRGGVKSTSQKKIHQLLLSYAKKGKKIVRLKGGDPFLFGRGAEELLFLKKHNISFEVIPGVTSAVAGPAYAGIPLTDRHRASSVGILTGTERSHKKNSRLRWNRLATGIDTLVFLMAVRTLPGIVRRLLQHGRPPKTPCALIQWGTSPHQKVVTGTLENILLEAKEIGSPAIFMVGEVVHLRRRLHWFNTKPLFGKRILVTRPEGQAKEFEKRLKEQGAEVLLLPTSHIVPLGKNKDLKELFTSLPKYDWCFLSSVNGVELFLSYCRRFKIPKKKLRSLHFAVIGPKTAEGLEQEGLKISLMPKIFTQEGLMTQIRERRIKLAQKKVLLFHAKGARTQLASFLKRQGAETRICHLYEAQRTSFSATPILKALEAGRIDIVTFTSASCVDHFLDYFPGKTPKALMNGTVVAAIGPITSRRCRNRGLHVGIQAKTHTTEGLIEAIANNLSKDDERK